jgi:hypothetical protein
MRHRRKLLLTLAALTLGAAGGVFAAPDKLPKPSDRDLCPVCGMLVAKYPNAGRSRCHPTIGNAAGDQGSDRIQRTRMRMLSSPARLLADM